MIYLQALGIHQSQQCRKFECWKCTKYVRDVKRRERQLCTHLRQIGSQRTCRVDAAVSTTASIKS